MDKIILRDLSAISEFETRYAVADTLMADELQQLASDADKLCFDLFGVTEADTAYPPDTRQSLDTWEASFEFLGGDFEEQENAFWNVFGVDVDGADGFYLECLEVIGRPLVCALRQLHPAASLRFAPGRKTDEQLEAEAEAWGRWLQNAKRT